MTLRGIITLVILAVLFALAVVWISRQGGWKGEGCNGNCASCCGGSGKNFHFMNHQTQKQGCCTKHGAAALFYSCFSRLFAQNAPRWAA